MNISFHSPEPLDATRKRDLLLLCGVVANVIQTFILKNEVDRNADALRKKVAECEVEIAERKRVEAALRVTQFSVDSAAEGVFWIEPNARFVYVNQAACDRLGYSSDELLSMSVPDIDPCFPAEVWPAQWDRVREQKSVSLESNHRTKSGELVPVEIIVNHLDFEGREYHIVHARDITERKQAEQRQREIIEQLEVILHGVADGIYAMDPSGQVVFANDAAAKSFGYPSAQAMLDDPFFDEVMRKYEITDDSGEPIPIDRLPGRQALEGERIREKILRFRPFGRDDEQWSIIKAVPIFGEEGEVRFSVVIRHDITGIKVAEQERDRLIMKLKDALAEVKTLQGFIPICANCKKIRDDEGFWQQIEKYIQDRSDAKFSHSICPECAKLLYPHLYS
jgi:PAS domain S-box-containing protein